MATPEQPDTEVVTTPTEEQIAGTGIEGPIQGFTPEEVNLPALAIRGQQATGIPNIITQTGKAGSFDPETGQFDTSQIEMLYDPTKHAVTSEELVDPTQTFQGSDVASQKLLGTGEDRTLQQASQDITAIPDVAIQADQAAQIANIERTYSNLPTPGVASQGTLQDTDAVDVGQVVDERTKAQFLERGSLAQAAEQDLAQEATVQYQLEKLTEGLETGDLPPWASPTVRKINAVMQQRGLGASSMAAAALAQGLMEAAVPIAAQDAQRFAAIQLANLNNQQQASLQNASTLANMDRQNLDNRMKAAQQNAQSFLQMNMTNTTNRQQMSVLDQQTKTQALFTDQAAENARLQFNATSANQVNQFYDQLGATVDTANRARDLAIQKFNVDEQNSVNEFNATMDNARDSFNVNMRNQIDQSNINWRRATNTEFTAQQNNANRVNAGILLGITTEAQNDIWQKYRDEAYQAYNAVENELGRAHALSLSILQNQFTDEMFQKTIDYKNKVAIGAGLAHFGGKALTSGLAALKSGKGIFDSLLGGGGVGGGVGGGAGGSAGNQTTGQGFMPVDNLYTTTPHTYAEYDSWGAISEDVKTLSEDYVYDYDEGQGGWEWYDDADTSMLSQWDSVNPGWEWSNNFNF